MGPVNGRTAMSANTGGNSGPGGGWSRLSDVTSVPVAALGPTDSTRREDEGEGDEPAHAPATPGAPLAPLIVHRPSMRVIDGMRRLDAAVRDGRREVPVRFFDGPAEEAFVLAVEANTRHGAPLSLRERRVAAARIVRSHPDWSDRAIASVTGLSAKTVGLLRRTAAGSREERSSRIGRDGRSRPVSSAEGRWIASRLIAENPGASLREIAARSGISPGTVRDVRNRLARGESPAAPRTRRAITPEQPPAPAPARPCPSPTAVRTPADVRTAAYRALRKDPSLQVTDAGRLLLRLLETHALDFRQWERIAETVPTDCVHTVSAMAESYADAWRHLAVRLKETAAHSRRHREPDHRDAPPAT